MTGQDEVSVSRTRRSLAGVPASADMLVEDHASQDRKAIVFPHARRKRAASIGVHGRYTEVFVCELVTDIGFAGSDTIWRSFRHSSNWFERKDDLSIWGKDKGMIESSGLNKFTT